MPLAVRNRFALAAALVLSFVTVRGARAQTSSDSLPNPYHAVENWAKMPEGRTWGAESGVGFDRKGNLWALDRCGGNSCAGRPEDPVVEFDSSGRFMKAFGGGMMVFPHGLYIDRDDNIWVTDADGKDGKGQQVFKFSPEGKVLLTLGKAGVAGDGPDTFNRPSAVVVAPNGDIFVADGHGGDSNARVVKFSKDGKFLKSWGKKGSGPGDLNEPHAITMDAKGRILVADRGNNRIQIFDQQGEFLDQWAQFGRPSAIFIDKDGMMYVPDNTDTRYPEWKRGIRIGRVADGKLTAFIPDPDQDPTHEGVGAESLATDRSGNLFAGEVRRKMVKEYVRQ